MQVEQMQPSGFYFQTFLFFVSFILPQALSNLTPQRLARERRGIAEGLFQDATFLVLVSEF
jgi:hypothetical protein